MRLARPPLPRSHVPTQFVWYFLVGGLSFLVDLALFATLLAAGVGVAVSLTLAFISGTFANYVLSRLLAFSGGRHARPVEISRLFAVALVGLAITGALVWVFMSLGLAAFTARFLATPLAVIWNFGARRLLVFDRNMPQGTWSLSARLLNAARNRHLP